MSFLPPHRLTHLFGLVLAGIVLASCQLMQPPPAAPVVALPPLDTTAAQHFRIDGARSVIQLKVYRDGMLARLGHNHVISATQIFGDVYRREPLYRTSFALQFPVAALQVDRPADRRRAGSDFPGEIPQAHIEGTRVNMLGPDLLQGGQYDTVELRSLGTQGRGSQQIWRVAVRVRDRVSELRVPVLVTASGNEITAQGATKLSQRALGLQPFCVLSGKLCVRDDIDAEFYLVAVPAR